MISNNIPKHPAKYSDSILKTIKPYIQDNWKILDPMSGTGKLKNIISPNDLWLNEIESEWAIQGLPAHITIGNALMLPFANNSFDAIVVSPTYANRLADHHNAKDKSKRNTYTHILGRQLHEQNSGKIQWGIGYQEFHKYAWSECDRVLKNNGTFILNISNHIRKGVEQKVSEWHLGFFIKCLKYKILEVIQVKTPRMRQGTNNKSRVLFENIFIMKKEIEEKFDWEPGINKILEEYDEAWRMLAQV
jgi:hypothetical protein